MAKRPKTGERRQTRQPLKIDKLPVAMRDAIQKLRAEGRTWDEIEEQSASWPSWSSASPEVLRLFPGKRLPRENLRRWYDLRVEQVQAEMRARFDRAQAFAQSFAARGVKELPAVITNALTEASFAILEAQDEASQAKAIDALLELGKLVAKFERNQIAHGQLTLDKEKLGIIRRKIEGVKGELKKKKLDPKALQQKLDEIYGITA